MEIKITFPGGKRVTAEFSGSGETDGMKVETDQPVKYGGDGSAPEPFKIFLASIGTCAGIFILGFCQKNGIPTDNISLVQRHEYESEGPGKSRLSRLVIDIVVPKDFPAKYHDALIRVADQCAVKKAIMSPPEFLINMVVAA
ncbi:MAG: OsmC family protein [Nitrospirae bacterium]|nr:OsmC family protein [Nitrospirota bacterium]